MTTQVRSYNLKQRILCTFFSPYRPVLLKANKQNLSKMSIIDNSNIYCVTHPAMILSTCKTQSNSTFFIEALLLTRNISTHQADAGSTSWAVFFTWTRENAVSDLNLAHSCSKNLCHKAIRT